MIYDPFNSEPCGPESFGGSDFDDVPSIKECDAWAAQFSSIENAEFETPTIDIIKDFTGAIIDVMRVGTNHADKHGWIQLHSGGKFYPAQPDPNLICIEDIAHSLSNTCRFSGHCREFYSVAQHSVLVSHLVGVEYALHGLLHDASEAYLVDMPKPVKRLEAMKPFRDIEDGVMQAVYHKFGLKPFEPTCVKQADVRMLATEARDLMSPLHPEWIQQSEPYPFTITPLPPSEAKKLFLSRYRELTR